MRLVSLAYLTIAGATPVEQVEAAAAAGFAAVGLRIAAPTAFDRGGDVIGNPRLVAGIRRACRQTGVRVFDAEVLTLRPDADPASFLPALETAAALEAAYVQTVCEDPDLGRAAERFALLCEAAAGFGLRVGLEFMRMRTVRTIEDAAALVGDRPNAGIVVDALHLSRSGGSPAAVAAAGPSRVAYVQLCDATREAPASEDLFAEARLGRLHPDDGALWLDDLLDVLPPDLPISVEVPNRADAACRCAERAARAWVATRRFLMRRDLRTGRGAPVEEKPCPS